jgi:HSP20 family protein
MAMRGGSNLVSTGNRPRSALGRSRSSDPALSLQWEIDRALDDFWQTLDRPLGQLMTAPLADASVPRVNMRDTDNALEVTVEIPGVDEEDIDVSITEGELTIRAEAEEERDSDQGRYTMREVALTRVERTIPIPEGLDIDNASAALRNGMLTITIPKKASAQSSSKRINVDTSAKQNQPSK